MCVCVYNKSNVTVASYILSLSAQEAPLQKRPEEVCCRFCLCSYTVRASLVPLIHSLSLNESSRLNTQCDLSSSANTHYRVEVGHVDFTSCSPQVWSAQCGAPSGTGLRHSLFLDRLTATSCEASVCALLACGLTVLPSLLSALPPEGAQTFQLWVLCPLYLSPKHGFILL